MGIHCVNFTPISNHCARKRASLCPLARSYQERHLINIFGAGENRNTAVVGYYGEWEISYF